MKKLLVAIIALSMTAAMADHHETKHMVTFGNFNDAGASSTFDFSTEKDETGSAESTTTNIALNYTYAINGTWMVGAKYANHKEGNSSKNFSGYGVKGYYNLHGSVNDTCYVGFHYDMITAANEDETTTMTLEYGHRFNVGSWKGMHLAFSPSLSYAMATTEFDAGGDDNDVNSLSWNWIKFDLLF